MAKATDTTYHIWAAEQREVTVGMVYVHTTMTILPWVLCHGDETQSCPADPRPAECNKNHILNSTVTVDHSCAAN